MRSRTSRRPTVWFETRRDLHCGDRKWVREQATPVLIVQSDAFPTSKTLVVLIGSPHEPATSMRVEVTPDPNNNLRKVSHVMIDSILPVRREQFGTRVGRLSDPDMRRIEMALLLVLGIGAPA